MDLLYLLIAIIPGLIIYSVFRNDTSIGQNPEYVVLIYGIFWSIPFFALVSYIGRAIYGELSVSILLEIVNTPIYVLGYFVLICIYTVIVVALATLWIKVLRPCISKLASKVARKHAYETMYCSAWSKIYHEYIDKYKILVGRLLKDGEVIALGQVGIMTSDNQLVKDISFLYQSEYSSYFPENDEPLLENLCTYVDLINGFVLELYDGENQTRLSK